MKACVIIRQLKGHEPVVMSVLLPPDEEKKIDNLENYFKYMAETIIYDFRAKFVEFSDADFYVNIVETC